MVPEAKEVLGKKRDGGRPPKVVVVDGMKCGRGRPLKEVVVDGKKCGRGRPPKVVVVDGKKRGRDRPPKVMHGKKRGRGRPPSRRQLIYRPLSMSALELTSNKRCSFYKIIMPSSRHENMLRLPAKFTRRFEGDFSSAAAVLIVPTGQAWKVRLHQEDNCFWFGEGWQEFRGYHSLHLGSFLFFKYAGNSNFRVHIFDVDACEIRYRCSSPPRDKLLEICLAKQSANKPCRQRKFDAIGGHGWLDVSSRDAVVVAGVAHAEGGRFDGDGSSDGCEVLDEPPYAKDDEVVDLTSEDEEQESDEERMECATAGNHARFTGNNDGTCRFEVLNSDEAREFSEERISQPCTMIYNQRWKLQA